MAERIEAKVWKYWFESEEVENMRMNRLIYMACVLDPRCKVGYLSWMLEAMYGKTKGEALTEEVSEEMAQMFEVYKVKYAPPPSKSTVQITTIENTINVGCTSSETVFMGGRFEAEFQKRRKEALERRIRNSTELDIYLRDLRDAINEDDDDQKFDILKWWSRYSVRYPILSKMVKDILAVPISSVSSEAAFSCGDRVLSPFKSSLNATTVEALICAENWIRYPDSDVIDDKEDDREQFDYENVNNTRHTLMESQSTSERS
ncbi:unnamed protein product [Linum trigynum]|uniref:Transposase n=1 Tax=Linum trigynum TaxID=586398 RepID=A0AAV2F540_9ROSI